MSRGTRSTPSQTRASFPPSPARFGSPLRCLSITSLLAVLIAASAPAAQAAVSFSGPTNFGAGNTPFSVAVGDFNGDSKPDLAVANYGSNDVSILLGDGSGGFTGPTNFAAGTNPIWV